MKQDRLPVRRWTRLARFLHWGTALAILIEVPAGFAMAWTYGRKGAGIEQFHLAASQTHHTIGLLLIAAVAVRLAWRARHRAPDLPAGTGALQASAARSVQLLLYLLLVLVPLSGWASLSAMAGGAGYPAPELWFFTMDGFGPDGWIPHIVPPVAWNAPTVLRYSTFAAVHRWLLVGGAAALALHVAGALWHHFVRRDSVLSDMLGPAEARRQEP